MSRAFLDQDFGSEEEDDDFNPEPAVESDVEASGERDEGEGSVRADDAGAAADGDDNDAEEEGGEEKAKTNTSGDQDVVEGDEEGADGGGEQDENQGEEAADDGEGEGDGEEEALGEEEEEEEEEEDEDEDEDEEEEVSRPRKRRRAGLNAFIETEAEVDEEDDAEEEEEEMDRDFVTEDHPDDLAALPIGAETDDRRHRELDRKREMEATLDAEQQAQALKERYGRNRAVAADMVVVPKRLLLPSVDDPSIWAVKVRPGKEREVVFNLMKRVEERPPGSRNPIRIFSAFERGGTMSGYVYVEARRQADVVDALDGLSNAYVRSKMTLIPVKEMPDLLRVNKSEELVPGAWVRIKRGKYQGDLAQVEEVETNGLDVTVRLVPRLDYGLNEDSSAPNGDSKRKRPGGANSVASRPPQRLFSEAEAKKKHSRYLSATTGLSGKEWNYLGETYFEGFLIKTLKVNHLITKNVNPQLDEVTMFARGSEDGTSNLDLASLAASLKNSVAEDSYLPGDTVEVYEGEQKGVVGKTVSTRGDIVTLKVTEGELEGQTMDVPMKSLRKRFREGDHVKVIGGSRFRDELGMVVRIKDDRVTVLTDMSMQEITVFSKDLREADDTGVDGKLGIYDVHDLVQLDQTTVGVVTKLDRGSLRVLDQNGSVRTVLPSQVINKIEPRRHAVTTDRNGYEIKFGDTVREVTGEQRLGTILHVHRSFLFLTSKVVGDNAGIIVTRASNVVTVSTSGRLSNRPAALDLSKMNPALQKSGMNGTGMPPPRTLGRDRLVGKTVTVRKGPYKGLMGRVKDTTDTTARVELHSVSKVIMVEKDNVTVKDPVTGQAIDINRLGGKGGSRVPMSAAPPGLDTWQGGRTPMAAADSSRTPAWRASSARTPAWGRPSGSHTPAWKADGSRTANPYDGNRTAYGGLGSRTPAWAAGTKTPYGSGTSYGGSTADSGFDAFVAGSRTPGHPGAQAGGRTPAWGPSTSSGASSRPFDAPTPGGDYSAPTPGAYGAPTPGATAATPRAWPDSAPTPGAANAPTPGNFGSKRAGAYDAPTPAVGMGMPATPAATGGDDGPRYEDTPSP
ncbi:hypothetical protein VTO42DRAFT_4949 [Malbranchea cinnamomea]